MARNKSTEERGVYKQLVQKALFSNKDIVELLLGSTDDMSQGEIIKGFKKHCMSHLFVDDTITDTDSFIFYDIVMTLHPQVKRCGIVMYVLCHRDILDDYDNEKYPGNRADALSQMVEETLVADDKTAMEFGIGHLSLDKVEIYNSRRMYGVAMQFSVPNFR